MKKIACLMMMLEMLALYCAGAAAEGNFEYSVSGGAVTITGYTGAPTALVIPKMIAGYPVTAIGDGAFAFCEGLERVVISEGVRSLGAGVFNGCESLKSVTLPAGIQHIPEETFALCTSLESIAIPDGVKSIGGGAFSGCAGLESVRIPASVTSIGYAAFGYCAGLRTVELEAAKPALDALGENAFYGCADFEILVPAGAKEAYVKALQSLDPDTDWAALVAQKGEAGSLPRTGDPSMLGAWLSLLGASAAGLKLRRKP